jgi:hypothetical protein
MGPRSNQPKRRTFSADYKLAMVAEVAAAVGERRRLKFRFVRGHQPARRQHRSQLLAPTVVG